MAGGNCRFKVSRQKALALLVDWHGGVADAPDVECPSPSFQFHLDSQPLPPNQGWAVHLASICRSQPQFPLLLASISLATRQQPQPSQPPNQQQTHASTGADAQPVTRRRLPGSTNPDAPQQPRSGNKRISAPWLVTTFLPAAFLRAQRCAQAVLNYYKEKGEAFPRPCPVCGSCEFFRPCAAHVTPEHMSGQSTSRLQLPTIGGAEPLQGSVDWGSRPLACDQCHRWWHMGCLGIHTLEDVPTLPWFHSKECRHTFLALEADAEAGQLPAWELGPRPGAFTVEMMTDADHRSFVLGAFEGGRGDMGEVYDLISRSFPSHLVLGYGSAAAEYAGGKYVLLLRSRGEPVAVATFDAYGPHAAQLHLLATAPEARGKGHARALLDILEYRLSKVGVQRLIAQPREASLPMFTDSLGWEVVHPVDAAHLHSEIPIGFFDTVLVEKQLL